MYKYRIVEERLKGNKVRFVPEYSTDPDNKIWYPVSVENNSRKCYKQYKQAFKAIEDFELFNCESHHILVHDIYL